MIARNILRLRGQGSAELMFKMLQSPFRLSQVICQIRMACAPRLNTMKRLDVYLKRHNIVSSVTMMTAARTIHITQKIDMIPAKPQRRENPESPEIPDPKTDPLPGLPVPIFPDVAIPIVPELPLPEIPEVPMPKSPVQVPKQLCLPIEALPHLSNVLMACCSLLVQADCPIEICLPKGRNKVAEYILKTCIDYIASSNRYQMPDTTSSTNEVFCVFFELISSHLENSVYKRLMTND